MSHLEVEQATLELLLSEIEIGNLASDSKPLADFGEQGKSQLRDCTLSEAQMPLRELPRSNYQLSNEAFTDMLVHELEIAPLAFAALSGPGHHAQRQGVHCACEKSTRVRESPWHRLSCSMVNKIRHNHLRDELAKCCRHYGD